MEEKRYVVVFLPSENIYSEMPTSWLTKDRDHCWWPRTLNARLFMKRGEEPDVDTWDLHDVQVEAYCSTLESARKKAEDPEFSTSNEMTEAGRGRRKKKNINHSSPESSLSSDDTLTPPPSPPTTKVLIHESVVLTHRHRENNKNELKSRSKMVEHGNVIQKGSSFVNESDITIGPDGHGTIKTNLSNHTNSQTPLIVVNEELSTSAIETDNNIEFIIDENLSLSAISSEGSSHNDGNIAVASSESGNITLDKLSLQIANLKTICLANQKYIKDVNKTLKSMIMKEGGHIIDTHMNLIHGKIPLNDIEDLKLFDADISNQEEMKKVFIAHMKAIGGRDSKDHLYRCLSKIFTNELATQCSWYGQRGNFRLSDLNIMKILSDVVLSKNKNDVTLNEVEKHVGEWFRLGKQRLNREKK